MVLTRPERGRPVTAGTSGPELSAEVSAVLDRASGVVPRGVIDTDHASSLQVGLLQR